MSIVQEMSDILDGTVSQGSDDINTADAQIIQVVLGKTDVVEAIDILSQSIEQLGFHAYHFFPIVKSLSLGNSLNAEAHIKRVCQVVHRLLERFPDLIFSYSHTTGCSPLHVALRNYGNVPELINMLIQADPDNKALKHANVFGDLPCHIASAVRAPGEVLQCILVRTWQADIPLTANTTVPHPLIWSVNNAGYTPAHLELFRQWDYDSRPTLCLQGYSPLRSYGHARGRSEQVDKSLWERVVEQVISTPETPHQPRILEEFTWSHVQRVCIIIHVALQGHRPMDLPHLAEQYLHKASAMCGPWSPTLPAQLVDLLLWKYPEKVTQMDDFHKYPLHYACTHYKTSDQVSDQELRGWKRWIEALVERAPHVLTCRDIHGRMPLHYVLSPGESNSLKELQLTQGDVVRYLVAKAPSSLAVRDPQTGLMPFAMASIGEQLSLDTIHWLLHAYPNAASCK